MNKVIDKGFRNCRFVSTIVKNPVYQLATLFLTTYNRGDQTAAREPHAALRTFACGSFELSEKLHICFLVFISIAKCRHFVKWYCDTYYLVCCTVLYFCKSFQKEI